MYEKDRFISRNMFCVGFVYVCLFVCTGDCNSVLISSEDIDNLKVLLSEVADRRRIKIEVFRSVAKSSLLTISECVQFAFSFKNRRKNQRIKIMQMSLNSVWFMFVHASRFD